MNAESLGIKNSEEVFEKLEKKMQQQYTTDLKKLRTKFPNFEETTKLEVDSSIAFVNNVSSQNWQKIKALEFWEDLEFGSLDGLAWYRNEFYLTEKEKEQGIQLNLGKIDDSDITFVNGYPIGSTFNAYADLRNYHIPSETLQIGKNTVLIKVYDTGGSGGMNGNVKDFSINTSEESRNFYENWEIFFEKIKKFKSNLPMNKVPTALYNKMIHPIIDFPLKGVLWYQGESNTSSEKDAFEYRNLFKAMISQWRNNFKSQDLPFLYVQLANFRKPSGQPQESSNWAVLRSHKAKH